MLFELNFKSGIPVYLQLVEQIKAAAASGTLRTGEPLPSIRPLAEQLRVNRNTVAKAYAELENQRIIETQAGKGSFLLEGASPLRKDVRKQMVGEAIDKAIIQARKKLRDAVRAVEAGRTPEGLGTTYYTLRAGEGVLPRDADWRKELTPDMRPEAILQTV